MLQVKATQERLLERDVGVLVVICGPGQVAGFASVNSLANHTSRARSAAPLVKTRLKRMQYRRGLASSTYRKAERTR